MKGGRMAAWGWLFTPHRLCDHMLIHWAMQLCPWCEWATEKLWDESKSPGSVASGPPLGM
jgi:hypothetical protein